MGRLRFGGRSKENTKKQAQQNGTIYYYSQDFFYLEEIRSKLHRLVLTE